ncbi:MAG: hypothetical protein HY574_12350 [candidate division NC10 bacterium]|nr:hypothetical protein [candidate division NC10 bacterium]
METAEQVWTLVKSSSDSDLILAKLLPRYTRYKWLTEQERLELGATAKRALVIVLDRMIAAGLKHGTITFNSIFDALAARYSDHHPESTATAVRDMSRNRAKRCRRDLLLNGVSVKALWRLATGSWARKDDNNPFYWVDRLPTGGYRVDYRKGSPALAEFLDIAREDPEYSPARPASGLRLLFDEMKPAREEKRPVRMPEREVCADIVYNEAKIGDRSESILRAQEEARLVFDVAAFVEDHNKVDADMQSLRQRLGPGEYDIDLDLANVKRKIRRRSKGTRLGKSSPKSIWSPRDEELFCRSLEKGFEIGWTIDDPDLEATCLKELEENGDKWTRHVRRYAEWRKRRERSATQVSCADLVKASLVARKWREEVRELLVRYDRARTHLGTFQEVYEQVTPGTVGVPRRSLRKSPTGRQYVDIRTGFCKIINRRYQPTHLWPTFVTSKNTRREERQGLSESDCESYRQRWFKARGPDGKICNLTGVDISSSQTQIIALLIGSDALLGITASKEKSLKDRLAEWAWTKHQDPGDTFKLREGCKPYSGPKDERLRDLVKNLWMRVCYGSPEYQVVQDQWDDPVTYGPGWSKQKGAEELLEAQPGYGEMKEFLEVLRKVARLAYGTNRYDGVRLVDPFDKAGVRWNPVERVEYELGIEGQKLTLSVPGTKKRDGTRVLRRGKEGAYPVDMRELRKMLPPCLVHMLDAFFSSLVMENLARYGVRDFVGIHDCWLVPQSVRINAETKEGRKVLEQAIDEAAAEWYVGLGPIYSFFEKYLGADEPYVKRMKRRWEECMEGQNYPKFVYRSI